MQPTINETTNQYKNIFNGRVSYIVELREAIVIRNHVEIAFTTHPKTRRRVSFSCFLSRKRALEFMAHLWEVGLKKCSYETLEWEFVQHFGSNDKRTVERYLGRPEKIERHVGLSKVVRMNRQSGKVAQFEYMNERKLPAKKGLLEILGYISRVKEGNEWRYVIHHERMPYYTVQTTLTEPEHETETRETANILQELEGSSEESILDLRVCSLYAKPHSHKETEGVRGKGLGENPIFCEAERGGSVPPMGLSPTNKRGETAEGGEKRRREEVIDCTHTNQDWKSVTIFKKGTETVIPNSKNKNC